jgi:hypothetical protein
MTTGIAAPAYEKLAEMAIKLDSTKYKAQAVSAWTYLTTYYNDAKKDSKTALTYVEKILQVEPTNQFANAALPILKKASSKPATPAQQPRRSGGGGSGSTGKSATTAADAKKK